MEVSSSSTAINTMISNLPRDYFRSSIGLSDPRRDMPFEGKRCPSCKSPSAPGFARVLCKMSFELEIAFVSRCNIAPSKPRTQRMVFLQIWGQACHPPRTHSQDVVCGPYGRFFYPSIARLSIAHFSTTHGFKMHKLSPPAKHSMQATSRPSRQEKRRN